MKVAILLALMIPFATKQLSAQDARVAWLRENIVPLRTIGADSTDFSDLEPLRAKLAGVRVVQLAELSHGDGNGSAARVRLIKFLHERMGFNVLVWEAGFYDVERLNTLLGGDFPIDRVAESALWPFWSESAQIAPLFTYARSTHRTHTPLLMEGFDLQLTGGGWSVSGFLADVRSWFDVAKRPLPSGVVLALDSAQQRLSRNGGTQIAVPLDILLTQAPAVLAHFDAHAAALREAHGALRAGRYRRVLQNLVEYRSMLQDRERSRAGGPGSMDALLRSYYQRERSNADNLLWLINERYRNEKLIVWLHNVHAVNARISLGYDSLFATERPIAYESTGRLLKQQLRAALYSIATFSYQGEWGFPNQRTQPVSQALPGSLVELLKQATELPVILDLRAARAPGHWLMQPLAGSITASMPDRWATAVWPDAFDGLLFLPRLTRASAK